MSKSTTHKATVVRYGTTLALSLVAYAQQHEEFAVWLRALIQSYELDELETEVPLLQCPAILPKNDAQASRRAYWLLDALLDHRIDGARSTLAVLSTWAHAHDRSEPRAVVLGIKYGILDYGIIGQPKKRANPMDVLMRTDVRRTMSPEALLKTVVPLTHGIVEQGLVQASGNTGNLEPELGDWLFSDKPLAFFTGSKKTLVDVEQHLLANAVPHTAVHDAAGPQLLALTPSIDVRDIESGARLRSIQD